MDILVVDDEAQILRLLERGLASSEVRVTTAGSGKEALTQLRHQRFDILLTDLMMDEPDGLDLTQSVRRNQPGMDVIVMTGFPTLDHVVNAFKLGAYDFITKPIDLMILKAAIKRCAERREFKARLASAAAGLRDAAASLRDLDERLAALKRDPADAFNVERDLLRRSLKAALNKLDGFEQPAEPSKA